MTHLESGPYRAEVSASGTTMGMAISGPIGNRGDFHTWWSFPDEEYKNNMAKLLRMIADELEGKE